MRLPRWSDERVELVMGNLLRLGVTAAATIVLLGGAAYLFHHGRDPVTYGTFQGEPADLTHVGGIVRDALALTPRGLMQLGLLVLIATPVARVVLALLAFALQRDRLYVVVTAIVLAILLFSLAGGGP
jgi:uncharacterized membrane protein